VSSSLDASFDASFDASVRGAQDTLLLGVVCEQLHACVQCMSLDRLIEPGNFWDADDLDAAVLGMPPAG
jgi:hypothetical protein